MSHFTIWHYMAAWCSPHLDISFSGPKSEVEHNIPSALILEDDFDLLLGIEMETWRHRQENFKERLGSCLEEARGHSWNLMFLGGFVKRPKAAKRAKVSRPKPNGGRHL